MSNDTYDYSVVFDWTDNGKHGRSEIDWVTNEPIVTKHDLRQTERDIAIAGRYDKVEIVRIRPILNRTVSWEY
jgi:hypothetical protein